MPAALCDTHRISIIYFNYPHGDGSLVSFTSRRNGGPPNSIRDGGNRGTQNFTFDINSAARADSRKCTGGHLSRCKCISLAGDGVTRDCPSNPRSIAYLRFAAGLFYKLRNNKKADGRSLVKTRARVRKKKRGLKEEDFVLTVHEGPFPVTAPAISHCVNSHAKLEYHQQCSLSFYILTVDARKQCRSIASTIFRRVSR